MSHTFAEKFDASLGIIPQHYRSSVGLLQKLNTTTITLDQLRTRMYDVSNDAKYPKFHDVIGEKLNQIARIARQLGEDMAFYPPVCFEPGRLLDELNAIIEIKEQQLVSAKSVTMNKSNTSICLHFLHGDCDRGATCSFSHTAETLKAWFQEWVTSQIMQYGGDVLSVVEDFGAEAWVVLLEMVPSHDFHSLVLRTVHGSALRALVQALMGNRLNTIHTLDISKNNLGKVFPRGILKLAKSLSDNRSLTRLSLGYNALGVAGSLALCSAVRGAKHTQLQTLNLQCNNIRFEAHLETLCRCIAEIPTLVKLGLATNELREEGVAVLLQAIQGHAAIEYLDLFAVKMGDTGAGHLGDFLMNTPCGANLKYVNIGWNGISTEGFEKVCAGVENHTKLEMLKVHYNIQIRKGWLKLVEVLKANSSLTSIDLRWTSVSDDAVASLSEALSANKTLKELNIAHNDMESRSETQIAEKLKRRTTTSTATVTYTETVW